jgi:transcriptional regulator with XRE-family HTH domain
MIVMSDVKKRTRKPMTILGLLKERKLDPTRFAARVGVSYPTLIRWNKKGGDPRGSVLQRMADDLGMAEGEVRKVLDPQAATKGGRR